MKQESGQQPFLRDAMEDVANTVEYMLQCEQNEWRGISSVGRAPALQAGCQEFESPILHPERVINYEDYD